MKLLDEIRQQPLHIRKIFMWCMVVITFSMVGLWYANSTKNQIVALLNTNPPAGTQNSAVAEESQGSSPFALMARTLRDLRAQISSFFARETPTLLPPRNTAAPVPPQQLP